MGGEQDSKALNMKTGDSCSIATDLLGNTNHKLLFKIY